MALIGHVWSFEWFSPYTQPPDGAPRKLVEVFVPLTGASNRQPSELGRVVRPRGYAVYSTALAEPMRSLPPETLGRIRRQRLAARLESKVPMFADEFTATALAERPDYFEGFDAARDEARARVLGAERERYEYLIIHPNELLRYDV